MFEDVVEIRRPPKAGSHLDHLHANLVDDLSSQCVQLVRRMRHRRVETDQGLVHVVPIGQVTDSGVVVVTSGGQHRRLQTVAVGRQCRPDGGFERGLDGREEGLVLFLVHAGNAADARIAEEEIELGDSRLDQPRDCGTPRGAAGFVTISCDGQCVRQGAEPGEVAVPALFGLERQLRQGGEDVVDRRHEGVADGELDQRDCRGVSHASTEVTDEVERLLLELTEPRARLLFGSSGDGPEAPHLVRLGLLREVGQQVVVPGKAVDRAGEWFGVECRRQELGRQFLGGHQVSAIRRSSFIGGLG